MGLHSLLRTKAIEVDLTFTDLRDHHRRLAHNHLPADEQAALEQLFLLKTDDRMIFLGVYFVGNLKDRAVPVQDESLFRHTITDWMLGIHLDMFPALSGSRLILRRWNR